MSGRKRLKSGSSTTGATNPKSSTATAAAGAATTGHQLGNARASPTRARIATEVRTTPTPKPLSRSKSQPRAVWVENPKRRSRTSPRQNASGSRTSVETPTTSAGKASARPHQGSESTAP